MSNSTGHPPAEPAPTVREALHARIDEDFDDVVPFVQVEHELAGFETVAVNRLDNLVRAAMGEDLHKTALIVVCHAEIAKEALEIDPTLAGLLPCTTTVYQPAPDEPVHVHHTSTTKAIRDLGCAQNARPAVEALVELTGEVMDEAWKNIAAESIDG